MPLCARSPRRVCTWWSWRVWGPQVWSCVPGEAEAGSSIRTPLGLLCGPWLRCWGLSRGQCYCVQGFRRRPLPVPPSASSASRQRRVHALLILPCSLNDASTLTSNPCLSLVQSCRQPRPPPPPPRGLAPPALSGCVARSWRPSWCSAYPMVRVVPPRGLPGYGIVMEEGGWGAQGYSAFHISIPPIVLSRAVTLVRGEAERAPTEC